MTLLSVGEAAKAVGASPEIMRWWEAQGLIPPPPRSAGGRRAYDPAAVRRLRFIRHARALGFSIDAIRDLLALADQPDAPCAAAHETACRRLAEVEARLARLTELRDALRGLADPCCGVASTCTVIGALADAPYDVTTPLAAGWRED